MYIRVFVYIYIYIYRERERDTPTCIDTYVYIYMHTHTHTHYVTYLNRAPLPSSPTEGCPACQGSWPRRPLCADYIILHYCIIHSICIYLYIYIYIHMYRCIYIYIYREREIHTHTYCIMIGPKWSPWVNQLSCASI